MLACFFTFIVILWNTGYISNWKFVEYHISRLFFTFYGIYYIIYKRLLLAKF